MNEHDDEGEGEYGTPFWAYSDDEDLDDLGGGMTVQSWDPGLGMEDLGFSDEHAHPDLREGWVDDDEPSEDRPPSREAVERLLDRPHLTWGACRQAVDTARLLGAWDLVERAALRALRVAQDRGFDSGSTLGRAARQVLVAKCATATLDGLAASLDDGEARLRAVVNDARRAGRSALADAVDGEVQLASKILLLLGSTDDSAALASLAANLRRIDRPDLADEIATRAIDLQPDNPAAWVARAAARVDQRNHKGALADLDRELLNGNIYAAITKIKVLRAIGRLSDALALALTTAQAKPSRHSLTMLRALAAQTGDGQAQAVAERLFEQVHAGNPDLPGSRLLSLLAAEQLDRDGDHGAALLLAELAAADGPAWARAANLVARLRRTAA